MGTDLEPHPMDADQTPRGLYGWLDERLFPAIIRYTTHPLHIVALLALWIGLLVFHSTLFELVGGNYTNGLSAMAASIVLLQQTNTRQDVMVFARPRSPDLEEDSAPCHCPLRLRSYG